MLAYQVQAKLAFEYAHGLRETLVSCTIRPFNQISISEIHYPKGQQKLFIPSSEVCKYPWLFIVLSLKMFSLEPANNPLNYSCGTLVVLYGVYCYLSDDMQRSGLRGSEVHLWRLPFNMCHFKGIHYLPRKLSVQCPILQKNLVLQVSYLHK